ncbi:hypothetical protein E4U53_002521 [Claviceps sorghi]|nr:hypothetical protein E4U53_002521 [Claviceps sorghi]
MSSETPPPVLFGRYQKPGPRLVRPAQRSAVAVAIKAEPSTLQTARTRAALARAATEATNGAISRERGRAESRCAGTAPALGTLDAILVGELEGGEFGDGQADEEETELELHDWV